MFPFFANMGDPQGTGFGKDAEGRTFMSMFGNPIFLGGGKGGGGSSSGGVPLPGLPGGGGGSGANAPYQWAFPQYSQTWAFTPPAPTAFQRPPAFDANSKTGYAAAPTSPATSTKGQVSGGQKGKQTTGAFSLVNLMNKYK